MAGRQVQVLMENGAKLILANARVLTLDPLNPSAEAVAVARDRIEAVGSTRYVSSFRGSQSVVIDCRGLPLIPGIHDAHTHIMATAASQSGLDCRSTGLDSVGKLLAAIGKRRAALSSGHWIRGYGLEPEALREERYPTRWELDSVTPQHPVRLEHSSGHAALLNSRALAMAGIDADTPDPPDGVIDRDENGVPTGLLLEMGAYLRERLGRTRTDEEMETGVACLSKALLSYGITSVQDAGPENGPCQWESLRSLLDRRLFQPRVTMMAGVENLEEMAACGLSWGCGDDRLRVGHAKIILTCTTGQLMPAPEDLSERALRAGNLGFPIAVHAIEQEAVEEAIRVMSLENPPGEASKGKGDRPAFHSPVKNRVEHCAECPARLIQELTHAGAMVVTQPGFIYWRGDGYLERVQPDLLPHLYPIGKMMKLGIPVAFGSDSPVIDPNPWPGIYSAVTGFTGGGARFSRSFAVSQGTLPESNGPALLRALAAHTVAGAESEGTQRSRGMIREGMVADLALLDRPMNEICGEGILRTKSRLTIVGGKIEWGDGEI